MMRSSVSSTRDSRFPYRLFIVAAISAGCGSQKLLVGSNDGGGIESGVTPDTLTDQDARDESVADAQPDASPGCLIPAGVSSVTGGSAGLFFSVAVGDVDADGKPDLVVAHYLGGLGVLLGRGDGTFQDATTYRAPGAMFLALGDLNGDHKVDVALAGDNLGVMLGNGDGTFQEPVSHSVGEPTGSVVMADLDGDGKAALALAGNATGSIANVLVLLGNGDGTFKAPVSYDAGAGTPQSQSLAVGDLNGDGHPDLAVSSDNVDGVSVLLGIGDGRFGRQRRFSTGNLSQPISLALGDLDGDGKRDLTVAGAGRAGVLLGNGDGTFQPVIQSTTPSPAQVVIGDIDGDGRADLVAPTLADVDVLFGDSEGGFRPPVALASGLANPQSVAIADLDGDHKPDLAITNHDNGSTTVFLDRCGL